MRPPAPASPVWLRLLPTCHALRCRRLPPWLFHCMAAPVDVVPQVAAYAARRSQRRRVHREAFRPVSFATPSTFGGFSRVADLIDQGSMNARPWSLRERRYIKPTPAKPMMIIRVRRYRGRKIKLPVAMIYFFCLRCLSISEAMSSCPNGLGCPSMAR
jgi:hypothetical protein